MLQPLTHKLWVELCGSILQPSISNPAHGFIDCEVRGGFRGVCNGGGFEQLTRDEYTI